MTNETKELGIEEALDLVQKKLDARNVQYTVEKSEGVVNVYFDKENNFRCIITEMDIQVEHLVGYRMFNLAEGYEYDIQSVDDAIEHIFKVMENPLVQVETYKFGKLCCTRQFLIINNDRVSCSGLWIVNKLYFVPFIPKVTKEINYRYNSVYNIGEEI